MSRLVVEPWPQGCPPHSSLFTCLGAACALSFAALGSAYGTWKSAQGLFAVVQTHPEYLFKSILPVIMAGIVGIYGLVTAVIMIPGLDFPYSEFQGFANLAGGIGVGITGLASGVCIGVAGDVAVRAMAVQPQLIMGAMLILIFGEVLGLYGFIVAIIISTKSHDCNVFASLPTKM